MDLRWTWLPQKLQSVGYRTHGFGKEHTGFKSVHQLWSNRGFTSSIGSLLTGGNYYYSIGKSSGGPRWQDQHPIYNDSIFVNKPSNCHEQVGSAEGMCVQEYSTALWGQAAVQAVEAHELPSPLFVHLCFQAVHEPYDAPPPGWRGPSAAAAPSALEEAGQTCVDTESWYTGETFTCADKHPTVDTNATTPGDCCSSCSADGNCTHWTFSASQKSSCSHWTGANCKRVVDAGAISANLRRARPSPSPSPPGPPSPPDPEGGGLGVYKQMLWDADLYVGRLVAAVKNKGMWDNSVWIYSADNGGTGDGINWCEEPALPTNHSPSRARSLALALAHCMAVHGKFRS